MNGSIATVLPRSSPISPAASAVRCSFLTKPISSHARRWRLWRHGSRSTRHPDPVRRRGERPSEAGSGFVVDCRGLAARDALPDLRGVRGEMVVVRTHDISLSRPVRLLHPRIPLYIVPRGDGVFMIGATMIESEERRAVSVRSAVELLNAAYTLHPAFGEAEIVELGADLRPAFPRQPAVRAAQSAACCTPTGFSGMVSCSRPGWRGKLPMPFFWRREMRIFLNDDMHEVAPGTLAAALETLGFGGRKIATAVNGCFVAAARTAAHSAGRRRQDRSRRADAGRLAPHVVLIFLLRHRAEVAAAARHVALSLAGGPRTRDQGVGRGSRDRSRCGARAARVAPARASGRSSSRWACACCPTRRAAIR